MRGPLAQLLATTTCHGVPDWYGAKSLPSKIFWGLVLIAAFGAIGYYQYNLVVTFASVPTATKISKVIVNYVAFPNVTVCNQNSFSMRRLNNKFAEIQPAFLKFINQTSTSIELLQWLRYGTITSVTEFSAYAYRELPEKEYQILFNKSIDTSPFPKYDFTQFMMDIGYSCSDIFTESLDCIYGNPKI